MNKLLLFDIDGTLISGRGLPKKVALNVIQKHFPDFKNGESVAFNGMTDPLIVQTILDVNDHSIDMDNPIINTILDDFVLELAKVVNPLNPPLLLPGIVELLEILKERDDTCLGLVTGNIIRGAEIKLKAVDIYHYFKVGAFGSDHWNRNELPPIAIKRANERFGLEFKSKDVWIIGDSTKDVECAKANLLNCLAVETGKVSGDILKNSGADIVLPDLSDSDYFLNLIYNS